MPRPSPSRLLAVLAAVLGAALVAVTVPGPATAADEGPGSERYRPQVHFTPEKNWMNDPNGLVFKDGTWHLYFQHNPRGDTWGNMSWGHATSTDLVHWKEQPLAIAQGEDEDIFSGSVVVDAQNSSGFGTAQDPPMVAIYTSAYTGHPTYGRRQAQSLAYSTDDGQTWTKYAGNPVLDRGSENFRDPKVFWYDGGSPERSYWVMAAVEATDHQVLLYKSSDLRSWSFMSTFGPANATGGLWECPDLFPMPVDGDPSRTKWVMVVNINPGGVAGGSAGQYFVGDFDGTTFTSDTTRDPASAGPAGTSIAGFEDGYAGWTVRNEPGNRFDGPFGSAPATGALEGQSPVTGFTGRGLVNSFLDRDWSVGTLESPTFRIDQPHLNFLVGGGRHPRVSDKLDNDPPVGDLMFDGFESGGTLADQGWTSTGDLAASSQPAASGGDFVIGRGRINTYETGANPGDDRTGTLTSPTFRLDRRYLTMLVGGGRRAAGSDQQLEAQLLVGDEVVRTLAGDDAGTLNWKGWDVGDLVGQDVRLRVVDTATGGWGHLTLDHVVQSDSPAVPRSDETTVNLVVDGAVVRTATGADSETLDWRSWDLRDLQGKDASIRVVDNNRMGWGHVLADDFSLSTTPATPRAESFDWLDRGRDYYAAVSFSNAPDGRRVMLGWMSNWDYANQVPTSPWRSAMALPREVALRSTADGPRLVQQPVPEVDALARPSTYRASRVDVPAGERALPSRAWGTTQRIDVTLEPGSASDVGVSVLGDGTRSTRVGYDRATGRLYVDRRTSGDTGFSAAFPSRESVAVPLDARGRLPLRIYTDRSSVEVFTADGRHSITDLTFPPDGATRVSTYASGGSARVTSLQVSPLEPSMFLDDFAATGRPRVVGLARAGGVLLADAGPGWRPRATSVTYRWLRDGRPIAGATARHLRPGRADVGHALSVEVTARARGVRPAVVRSPAVTVRR